MSKPNHSPIHVYPFPSPSSLSSLTPSFQGVSAGHSSHPGDAYLSETKHSFIDQWLPVEYGYLFYATEASEGQQKLPQQMDLILKVRQKEPNSTLYQYCTIRPKEHIFLF